MPGKQDAIHVIGFALKPVGAGKDATDRIHIACFIRRDLDANTRILLGA